MTMNDLEIHLQMYRKLIFIDPPGPFQELTGPQRLSCRLCSGLQEIFQEGPPAGLPLRI
jgi:hypothetical protein